MLIDSILLPKMTVAKIQQLLCSKILVENQRLSASLKGVRFKDFDLFTEQGTAYGNSQTSQAIL